MTCRECHDDLPDGARFCVTCGASVVQDGVTEKLEPRPLLGMLHGEPIYEYDWAIWCDPAFIAVMPECLRP